MKPTRPQPACEALNRVVSTGVSRGRSVRTGPLSTLIAIDRGATHAAASSPPRWCIPETGFRHLDRSV